MDESEVLRFEQQTKQLKLSEAMRLGAKIRPQAFGMLWMGGGSCALGAAAEGAGFIYGEDISRIDFWAALQQVRKPPEFLESKLIAWNDDEGMSREAIADRLEAMGY
jgi:hypothetical protein